MANPKVRSLRTRTFRHYGKMSVEEAQQARAKWHAEHGVEHQRSSCK